MVNSLCSNNFVDFFLLLVPQIFMMVVVYVVPLSVLMLFIFLFKQKYRTRGWRWFFKQVGIMALVVLGVVLLTLAGIAIYGNFMGELRAPQMSGWHAAC